MFGEHYESLLASSGALVDLENDLQSTYMSTKLNQFGLTWNLSNNSKSVENPRKLQLQKMFRIPPSSSMNFLGFFSQFLAIFTELFSFEDVLIRKRADAGSTCRPHHFRPGPPAGGHWACRCHAPTASPAPHAFKAAAVPTGFVRRRHLASTVDVAVSPSRRRLHRPPPPSVARAGHNHITKLGRATVGVLHHHFPTIHLPRRRVQHHLTLLLRA
jgi:hypothetical protein